MSDLKRYQADSIRISIKDLPFESIKCDVSSYEEIKNVVTKIKKKNKKVSGLVNAAGIASMNLAVTTPKEVITKITVIPQKRKSIKVSNGIVLIAAIAKSPCVLPVI